MKLSKFDILLIILLLGYVGFMKFGKVSFENPKRGGVQFEKLSWEAALQKARDTKKPLFIDVYAQWCGPCKVMKKTTFQSDELGRFLADNTIAVAFDADTEEGKKVASILGVSAFPTILLVDSLGNVIGKKVGLTTTWGVKELVAN